MYDRNNGQQSIGSFLTQNRRIDEEDEGDADNVADELYKKLRRDSDVSNQLDVFSQIFRSDFREFRKKNGFRKTYGEK